MAVKAGYVAREVGINLKRNVTLTLATVATVAVSLTLVGSAYLISVGVQDAQQQFRGGVEFIVFMQPDAPDEQIEAVRQELEDNPQVRDFDYYDQEAAYDEFLELFADEPDITESVTPDILPPSFRVRPVDTDTDAVEALGAVFQNEVGVREVTFSSEAIERIESFYDFLSTRSAGAAAALVIAATLLVLNTIQMAILNRRRDIEVMKLVGATNWFIRVPFMLEGLVQGLIGALFAIGFTRIFINDLEDHAQHAGLLSAFSVSNSQSFSASILLIVAGALVSLIGSGIAVTRFLRV